MSGSELLRYVIPAATSWALGMASGHFPPHPVPGSFDVPAGWIRAGSAPRDYAMGVDRKIAHTGKASGFLRSSSPEPGGYGALMQVTDAAAYRGRRVRLSAWVRARGVKRGAGVWMRVDGPEPDHPLAFDYMEKRPIRGTSDWAEYAVVLDVAPQATSIAYGLLLDGRGRVWIDDLAFEEVDASVPVTGAAPDTAVGAPQRNLDFEH